MKRMVLFGWIVMLSTVITLAQELCDIEQDAFINGLDNCAESDLGTACYGSGDVQIISESENNNFASIGDTASLSEIDQLSTQMTDEAHGIAIMRLNRDDVPVRMLAYGDTTLHNTAPRHTITVLALYNLNLREEPSRQGRILSSLIYGNEYTAIGRLQDSSWIRVQLDDGLSGWVSAQYLRTLDGFDQLDVVTPNSPFYLAMQSFDLSTGDCGGVLLLAPEGADEAIIFGVNGAQIEVNGIVHVHTSEDLLTISSLEGEHTVRAFGFEVLIDTGQQTTIPLSEAGSLAGIPSDAEDTSDVGVSETIMEMLLTQ